MFNVEIMVPNRREVTIKVVTSLDSIVLFNIDSGRGRGAGNVAHFERALFDLGGVDGRPFGE